MRLAQHAVSTDAHTPRKLIQVNLMPVDTKAATDRLMRFLAVEGVTGKEAAIGRELGAALQESGDLPRYRKALSAGSGNATVSRGPSERQFHGF
jgi:hypothetical protein